MKKFFFVFTILFFPIFSVLAADEARINIFTRSQSYPQTSFGSARRFEGLFNRGRARRIQHILEKYAYFDDLQVSGFNSLIIYESLDSLREILKIGRKLARNRRTPQPPPTFFNGDVVYTMLAPDWMIRPTESTWLDLPTQTTIRLSTSLLTSRSDWFMNQEWHFGEFDFLHFRSATPAKVDLFENFLFSKYQQLKQLMFMSDRDQLMVRLSSDFSSRMLFNSLRNEVLFDAEIDLRQMPFEVYFYSERALLNFIDENRDSLDRHWIFERHGRCLCFRPKVAPSPGEIEVGLSSRAILL